MIRCVIAAALVVELGCGFDGTSGAQDGASSPADARRDGAAAVDADGDAPVVDASTPVDAAACGSNCTDEPNATCRADGTCVFDCANDECSDRVVCPDNIPCEVNCTGVDSCGGGVDCAGATGCAVNCTGVSACNNVVTCGTARCDVACLGPSSCNGATNCDAACACTVTCAVNACNGNADCPHSGCDVGEGCMATLPMCDTCP